jgi:hypothetical protein
MYRSVLTHARPHHDEVTVVIETHVRAFLDTRAVGVHLELGALRHAVGGVALGKDPGTVGVLVVSRPHDDEVTVGVHTSGRNKTPTIRGIRHPCCPNADDSTAFEQNELLT